MKIAVDARMINEFTNIKSSFLAPKAKGDKNE